MQWTMIGALAAGALVVATPARAQLGSVAADLDPAKAQAAAAQVEAGAAAKAGEAKAAAKGEAAKAEQSASAEAGGLKATAKKKVDATATGAKKKTGAAKTKANQKIESAPGGVVLEPVKGVAGAKVQELGSSADRKTDAANAAGQGAIDKIAK